MQNNSPSDAPFAESEAIDPNVVLALLGFDAPSAVEPLSGGMTMAMWRMEYDDQQYVLRVYPADVSKRFQHELAAMERARRGGIPVPRVHAVAMYGARPVMVMDWCHGRTLAAALAAQPWRVWHWGIQFGRMQAAIHALAHPSGDHEWIKWVGDEELPLDDRLRRLEPRQQLLHLDYHVLNVLVDDQQITAVLDWTNAHAGDPSADAARTYTIAWVEPLEPTIMRPVIRATLWFFVRAWWRGYRAASDVSTISPLLYAWAGAVMTNDLAPRVDNPDSWWQPRHLEAIKRWTRRWKRKAGLPT